MSKAYFPDEVFEMERDMIDVTSMHRPDISMVVIDDHGHFHPWCTPDGQPATGYNPRVQYNIPSLRWVKTGVEYYDDGEPYDVGEWRCRQCKAVVVPPYTADSTVHYVAGLAHYRINDVEVSKEEFETRYAAAVAAQKEK